MWINFLTQAADEETVSRGKESSPGLLVTRFDANEWIHMKLIFTQALICDNVWHILIASISKSFY